MHRFFRSVVAALSIVAVPASAIAAPGDANAAAKSLRQSFEAVSSITSPEERKAASEKFGEECKKYIAEYEGKVTEGPAYVTLGLAYMFSGDREKGSAILEKHQQGLIGKPAPSLDVWHVVGKGDGKWSFADAKGKVVLVDFWATWCPPCRQVIPDLVKMYGEREKDGLLVVGATQIYGYGFLKGEQKKGLDKEAELKLNADFKDDFKITYPIVFCEKNTGMVNYGVMGIPTLVLVDRDGIVRHVQTGAGEHDEMAKKVEECLAKKAGGAGY